MEYLVTSKEMAGYDEATITPDTTGGMRYDKATINKIGIPALVLMERAALAVCEEVIAYVHAASKCYRVLIMAGCGNNGADGLAIARMLSEYKEEGEAVFQVDTVICGNQEKATEQWKHQYEILQHFPVRIGRKSQAGEYDILIDALFGVGLSREIGGEYRELIQWVNEACGFKVAVDVPSGIHSDDGRVMGCAVRADLTVCFAFGKRGLYFYPGCEYAGKVKVKDIGIGEASFGESKPGMFRYTENIQKLLPKRSADGNKATFGKVLLAAGNRNMAGAAVLSAKAALRSGVGMVKVLTRECNREILQIAVPEALLSTEQPWIEERTEQLGTEKGSELPGKQEKQQSKFFTWPDVLAVGPGLGTDDWAYEVLYSFLTDSKLPLVIDADGLNLLSSHEELMQLVKKQGEEGRTIILTPHVGELARLCGVSISEIKAEPVKIAMELAGKLHCVVVRKDARTLICEAGKPICMNTTGNSGMAAAGSGDVLTGVIAGLLAQGMKGFDAACTGVYLHGLAGDKIASKMGEYAMTSGDLVQGIMEVTGPEGVRESRVQ